MEPIFHNADALILQQLRWRYATKIFDPAQKISPQHWETLEAAMILAPSSYGLQPWKFVVVTSQNVKDQLPAAAWNQSQPKDCSHFVVIAARRTTSPEFVEKLMEALSAQRNTPLSSLDSSRRAILAKASRLQGGQLEWNARQCYIPLGILLETAALLGIDACPMEGIIPEKTDELLGLSGTEFTSIVACALGYRAKSDASATYQKVRYPASDVVKHI